MRSQSWWMAVIVAAGCQGDDGAKEPTRCEQLRDHVITMRLIGATGVDAVAHAEALQSSMGSSFLASCASQLSPAQLECALQATTTETVARCAEASR